MNDKNITPINSGFVNGTQFHADEINHPDPIPTPHMDVRQDFGIGYEKMRIDKSGNIFDSNIELKNDFLKNS
ncbi:hypothetical protein [Gracilimonas sp.]|uniref:hypothetical protein n=1 Tax=Gracilimonas sp. TaxID=1974203 RepID=UPI003D12EFAB